jgi:hypothetical protein
MGWLSKKRQMQGARWSSHEAYLGTSKPRDNRSNAAVGKFLRRHQREEDGNGKAMQKCDSGIFRRLLL